MLCRHERHIILSRIMFNMKIHYTYCIVLMWNDTLYSDVQWKFLKWYIAFGHTMRILGNTLYSDIQWDFKRNIAFGCTIWFLKGYYTRTYSMILRKYYTRTYSMIFDWILYSDLQYNFWFYTALERTVWFLTKYYTRNYSMIFDWILYSDV